MSIFGFTEDKKFSGKNFLAAAKMVEHGSIKADLVEKVVQQEIEKNKFKYQYPASVAAAEVHRDAFKYGFNPYKKGEPMRVCPCCM